MDPRYTKPLGQAPTIDVLMSIGEGMFRILWIRENENVAIMKSCNCMSVEKHFYGFPKE
jgi:hypothetical protein